MVGVEQIISIGTIALGMAVTPGPNMIYLLARSLSQGKKAGLLSLAGVGLGFVFYMFSSALGLSTLFKTIPITYDIVKTVGAIYLMYLAYKMAVSDNGSPFEVQSLPPYSSKKLFSMGFLTNLFNPKIALMYGAVIPQFIDTSIESTFSQFLVLGLVQTSVAICVLGSIVLASSSLSSKLNQRPKWLKTQKWITASLLGLFALNILIQNPPSL